MHWCHHANATPLPMQHAIYNTGTWNSHWATKSKIAIQYSIMPNDYHKIVVEIVCSSCFLKIVPIPWSLSTNTESNLVCKWALFGFVVFFRSFFMRMHKYKWFKIDSKCETDCDAHFVTNIWPCMDRKLRAISNLFAINVKMLPLLLFFLSLFNGIGWKL